MVLLSVVGLAGVWHKKWMMEVYVEIVILAGSGTAAAAAAACVRRETSRQSSKADRGSLNPRDTHSRTAAAHWRDKKFIWKTRRRRHTWATQKKTHIEPEGHTQPDISTKRSFNTFPYSGAYKLFRGIQNEPKGHTQTDTNTKIESQGYTQTILFCSEQSRFMGACRNIISLKCTKWDFC